VAASSRQTVLKVESTPGKVCTGERLNQQRGMADERNVQLRSDHLSCRVRIEVLLRSFVVTQAKLLTNKQVVMKKALGETQTLPVRRSQKNVAPPADHFPGAQDGQNLMSWKGSLLAPTDPVW